jgi:hypothetical protein
MAYPIRGPTSAAAAVSQKSPAPGTRKGGARVSQKPTVLLRFSQKHFESRLLRCTDQRSGRNSRGHGGERIAAERSESASQNSFLIPVNALFPTMLAQAICTFKQGRIADRSTEAQQYRASGLNLLIAAIVYWNSTYMADAVVHLRATGEVVPDEWLTHTSPVGWEHVGLPGDFLWDRAAALPVGRRSLNLVRRRDAA